MCGACRPPSRAGHRAGLDGEDGVLAVGVGAATGRSRGTRATRAPRVVRVLEAAVGVGLPRLDHARPGPASPSPSSTRPRIQIAPGVPSADHVRPVGPGQADGEGTARPSGRACAAASPVVVLGSNGVARVAPRSTMSHSKASAHSGRLGQVEPRRSAARARPVGDRVEDRVLSANSGSSGKYICVTSRCVNARPNSEKWMCAGRHALRGCPTGRRRA